MATATVQYLQLDANYDPIFDASSNLTDTAAVNQAIMTRLRLFLGEWWENLALGLPMFQSILGVLGSPQGLAAVQLLIQQNIAGTPFVTSVLDVSLSFVAGQVLVVYSAQTQFGAISGASLAVAPALNSASIG